MPYLCMGCYEVYDKDLGFCPKPSCRCEVVEIDDLILPAVKTLNKKNYPTTYCCSGHVYDSGCNIYVSFHPCLLKDFSKEEIQQTFKDLPQEWELIFDERDGFTIQHMIDYTLRETNEVALYEEIVKVNLSLLKFVKTLPCLEY